MSKGRFQRKHTVKTAGEKKKKKTGMYSLRFQNTSISMGTLHNRSYMQNSTYDKVYIK